MISKIREKFLRISIRGRILFFLSMLIIVSLFFTGIFFHKIYYSIMLRQVRDSSLQTCHSIISSINTILKTVNSYTKVIFSNDEIQLLLIAEDGYSEIALRNSVTRTLSSMISSIDEVSAIYVIDTRGHRYYAEREAYNYLYFNNDFYSDSWGRARVLRGASYVDINGGEIFSKVNSRGFLSNIRVINSLESQNPIGALVVNVPLEIIEDTFVEISKSYGTQIFLLNNEMDVILTNSKNYSKEKGFFREIADSVKNNFVYHRDNKVIYTYLPFNINGWSVLTITPIDSNKNSFTIFIFFFTLILLALFVFIGSVTVSRMITKPINILADSMGNIGNGELAKVSFHTSIHEFNKLRDGYNRLSDKILNLIEAVRSQEKSKRQKELEVLQAQIKPHFLYNTFDSIASLSLLGRNSDVFDMVTALGTFYRISLNKGKEIITLKQELEALESYIKILLIRYNNFIYSINTVTEYSSFAILKLILQPFVENAIYHGIKPLNYQGILLIRVSTTENGLSICIEDNGVGMDLENMDSILKSTDSFGIKGTIERIKLFYAVDNPVQIESTRGRGTKVYINLPVSGRNTNET